MTPTEQAKKRYYYISEGRLVARCDDNGDSLSNAEVWRHGKWEPTTPAELVWNAQPISEEKVLVYLKHKKGIA